MLRKERRSLLTFITKEKKTSPFTGRSCGYLKKQQQLTACLRDIYCFAKRGLQYIALLIKSNLNNTLWLFVSIPLKYVQLMPLVTMTIYCCMPSFVSPKISTSFNMQLLFGRHGVSMPRYPWTDGPEYITQCPIQPGSKFSQKIILSFEEGTLWWHAHSDWTRATVHGAIIIYPKNGTKYPFPKPNAEVPIILGISVVTFKG